jgi:hypothetical protein
VSRQAIFWVVPETSPNNAGYRVRTMPLAAALEEFSIVPKILPAEEFIASIKSIADEAALVILAKPSDTVMFLCMKYLASRGVRVIADIFDNYFSWSGPLYQRGLHRQWLRAVDPEVCSGVIASTPYLGAVLGKIGISNVCQVSDLAPGAPLDDLAGFELSAKWRNPQQIEVLWYGISGNPYFRAGLDDLISWGRVLLRIRDRLRGRVRLTICTNQVAAVGAALKYFTGEGIETRFVPWTAEVCDDLLQAAHLVLLPSNLSGFSLSKTHNRCSDALWRQCLVLASPNGPYANLNGAVYRDVNELCDDLLALDHSKVADKLRTAVGEISRTYSKSEHVQRLAGFIAERMAARNEVLEKTQTDSPHVLLLGSTIIPKSLDFARSLGFLTACFEGSHRDENIDLLFKANAAASNVVIRTSEKGKAATLESMLANGKRPQDIGVAFEKSGEVLSVSLSLPMLKPLLQAAEFAEGVVDAHSDLRERMHDIHTEIIITALRALGFSNFDLCTEMAGGWESYCRLAAPRLWKADRDLRQGWQQGHRNEYEPIRA